MFSWCYVGPTGPASNRTQPGILLFFSSEDQRGEKRCWDMLQGIRRARGDEHDAIRLLRTTMRPINETPDVG